MALALEQVTFRIASAHQLDFGTIPGFVYGREGTIALADYVITSSTAFIVFTFGSMIVAIQVASGQSSPRIIATMLLRDNTIRWAVGLFAYVLLLAVAVKSRVDTIPQSLVSIMGVLALTSVIVFMARKTNRREFVQIAGLAASGLMASGGPMAEAAQGAQARPAPRTMQPDPTAK